MINKEKIETCEKEALPELATGLDAQDIKYLVSLLTEKDDTLRYKCYLLLQSRSQKQADVYPYWDTFAEKLGSDNSYQRNIGLVMISENVRWDEQKKFNAVTDLYLTLCDDEKPVTVRQCIQSLCRVVQANHDCIPKVVDKLISIDILQRKETQQKLVLTDILTVFLEIQKIQPEERISRYICDALTGGVLDNKTKKIIEAQLP
jgi:hypothetical protein